MALSKDQIENIQIDHGLIFVNYGIAGQEYQLGPTRGGGAFEVTKNIRDIEYDGRKGKTKGLQVVDEINARLTVNHLDATLDTLQLAMPYATLNDNKLTCDSSSMGRIDEDNYLENVTMFAKTVGGEYKKITLYNAMSEADFTLTAAPKAEGEMPIEVYAHWDDSENGDDTLYTIEDIASVGPEVSVFEVENVTGSVSGIEIEFSKPVKLSSINEDNIKVIDDSGENVDGDLSYDQENKKVLFTADLGSGDYLVILSNLRSVAGDVLPLTIEDVTVS